VAAWKSAMQRFVGQLDPVAVSFGNAMGGASARPGPVPPTRRPGSLVLGLSVTGDEANGTPYISAYSERSGPSQGRRRSCDGEGPADDLFAKQLLRNGRTRGYG